MSIVLRLLGLFSIPAAGLLFFLLARSVGKEQPSRMKAHVMGVLMPSLMMAVNMVFMLSAFIAWCPAVWVPIILAGFGLGYLWGGSSRLYKKGETLVVKRTVLHLGLWVLSYSMTQLLSTVMPASIAAAGMGAMFFSTGSAVGMNTNLILRQKKLERLQPPAASIDVRAVEAGTCPKCGASAQATQRFCIRCGQPLVE